MFGTKALNGKIKILNVEIDSLKSRLFEAEMAHNRLLTHLQLHEVTEPATSATKKFLTDEEYKEWSKGRPEPTPYPYSGYPVGYPIYSSGGLFDDWLFKEGK